MTLFTTHMSCDALYTSTRQRRKYDKLLLCRVLPGAKSNKNMTWHKSATIHYKFIDSEIKL